MKLAAWVSLIGASLWVAPLATAQSVRVVVLPKHTLENQTAAESGLDTAASAALTRAGARVVDLEGALRSQRFALSDAVQSGRIPNELSVLQADALASLQLRCALASDRVLGSALKAEQCVLDTKVVAVSGGEVIYALSESFMGHGLSPQMAVQTVLDKQLPAAIEKSARSWLARLTQPDTWEVALSVRRLADRETARGLVKQLHGIPGVTGARLGVFDRDLAHYSLAGRGKAELDGLADALEADPRLSLSVSYEAPNVLSAEFDVAKANRRPVMVMAVASGSASQRQIAGELVRASLMNLPYLEMAHTQPLLAAPEQARSYELRLREKARQLRVPLLLTGGLHERAGVVSAELKLIETSSGRTLAAVASDAAAGAQAFDAAVRKLDAQFRAALGEPDLRQRLGLPSLNRLERDTRLVIYAFKVPLLDSAAAPQGSLFVRNTSSDVVNEGELSLSADGSQLGAWPVPRVQPGATLQLAVPLERAARMTQSYLPLTAAVTYRTGASYERVSAVAPLIRTDAVKDGNRPDSEPDAAVPEGYMTLIRDGVQLHNAGDWARALEQFSQAHRLFPSARTLRALGMVEFDLGHLQNAASYLEQALRSTVRPLTDGQRAALQQLVPRARAGLAAAAETASTL